MAQAFRNESNSMLGNFSFQNLNPFRSQQQQQQPPQNSNPPGNQQQPGNQQPNPEVGAGGNPNGNDPNRMQNPLDAFNGMWDAQEPSQSDAPPQFQINPEIMKKVSDSFDYTQGLPEELAMKFQNGEQFTNQEIMQLMSHVGRTTYSNAMNHHAHLTGKFVELSNGHAQKNLPKALKQHMTASRVRNHSAAQNNPVVQQHMETIGKQLASRYPDATEEWIAEQTASYFVEMAKAINPEAFQNATGNQPGGAKPAQQIDWDDFMLPGQRAA